MEDTSPPAPDTGQPGSDDPPTGPGRPARAAQGRLGRRHRSGPRRHRAGILPPAILGLTGPEPTSGAAGRRPGAPRAGAPTGVLNPADRDPADADAKPASGDPADGEDLVEDAEEAEEARRGAARRRRLVLAGLALTAVLSAVTLVATLVNSAPKPPAPREFTTVERERLAAMRVINYRDLRAGLHVTIEGGAARTDLLGWVDWSRQLVYLDVGGPGAGALRGLAQASPTVLMLRPDPTAVPAPAMPPLVPPADGWRLAPDRRLTPVLNLIFTLAADRPDPADGTGRWVGHDRVDAEPVDILEAALPGAAPAPTASATPVGPGDRTARYWLDQSGRLHRLVADLPGAGRVNIQFNRADRPTLRPIDALGGRPGLPRTLTAAERERWRQLPARLRAAGGATVTLAGPVSADTNLRGAGWLSWASGTAYYGVTDLDADGPRTLIRHNRAGVTRIDGVAAGSGSDPPPLPAPSTGWQTDPHRTEALDPLVDAALRAARGTGPKGNVRRVRGDSLAGTTVDVVEVGTARRPTRYWVDRAGLLRRVELPTRAGAWAQLNLTPGRVPRLTPSATTN